jgi:hypothetical protein
MTPSQTARSVVPVASYPIHDNPYIIIPKPQIVNLQLETLHQVTSTPSAYGTAGAWTQA